jgi:HD-GYP domain-containing protein (c-di-GMP phosphodiesterase class II)
VIKELKRGAGAQFDPKLLQTFIHLIEAGFHEEAKIGQDPPREETSP